MELSLLEPSSLLRLDALGWWRRRGQTRTRRRERFHPAQDVTFLPHHLPHLPPPPSILSPPTHLLCPTVRSHLSFPSLPSRRHSRRARMHRSPARPICRASRACRLPREREDRLRATNRRGARRRAGRPRRLISSFSTAALGTPFSPRFFSVRRVPALGKSAIVKANSSANQQRV